MTVAGVDVTDYANAFISRQGPRLPSLAEVSASLDSQACWPGPVTDCVDDPDDVLPTIFLMIEELELDGPDDVDDVFCGVFLKENIFLLYARW